MTLQKQVLIWTASFAVLVLVLWLLSPILLPFLAGFVLAYFLDPIADKALTMTALVLLSVEDVVPWWVTIVIITREIAVTALRFWFQPNGGTTKGLEKVQVTIDVTC